jgi:hypothetical protein
MLTDMAYGVAIAIIIRKAIIFLSAIAADTTKKGTSHAHAIVDTVLPDRHHHTGPALHWFPRAIQYGMAGAGARRHCFPGSNLPLVLISLPRKVVESNCFGGMIGLAGG